MHDHAEVWTFHHRYPFVLSVIDGGNWRLKSAKGPSFMTIVVIWLFTLMRYGFHNCRVYVTITGICPLHEA